MGLAKPKEQSGGEEVNDNKYVRVLIVKGKKITTTTTSVILVGGKLLTTSTKMTLPEGEQVVRVKKVWIETTG